MEKRVGLQLKKISCEVNRVVNSEAYVGKVDELTGTRGYILGYLIRHEGTFYQKDLEKIFSVRRSTMTEILNLMEKKGFIVRAPDETDKRLKRIVPTEEAKRYDKKIREAFDRFENDLTDGLSDEELDAFFAVLTKLGNNLNKMID